MQPDLSLRRFHLFAGIAALTFASCSNFEVVRLPQGQSVSRRPIVNAPTPTPGLSDDLPALEPERPALGAPALDLRGEPLASLNQERSSGPRSHESHGKLEPLGRPSKVPTQQPKPVLAKLALPTTANEGAATRVVGRIAKPEAGVYRAPLKEAVQETYARGSFAMEAGQDAEAIAAFDDVVRRDPGNVDAWGMLALLHQKGGDSAKAIEAFKKAKRLGDANGGIVTRGGTGNLPLP